MMIIWSFYESNWKPRNLSVAISVNWSHCLSSSMRTRAASAMARSYSRWRRATISRAHRICVEWMANKSNETYPQQLITANDGSLHNKQKREEGQLEIIKKFNIIILFVLSLRRFHRLCVWLSRRQRPIITIIISKLLCSIARRCRIPTMRRWGDEPHIWESRFRIPTVISIVIHLTARSNGYRVRIAFACHAKRRVEYAIFANMWVCIFTHFSKSRELSGEMCPSSFPSRRAIDFL